MKVTIETNEEKEITFPCLMENSDGSIKVWMNENNQGLVLETETEKYKQGDYCHFNICAFEPLPKGQRVILEN